ncbi:hypothetical protein [Mucilaginibacter sp.]|uniref:hypothetical protein n=1 Tax=Mucilaginibacter sp. TaxID=1882438 RepID=UPI002607C165|nr:hypothetical protein [Mucilaginibacter sp.]MDB4918668.1 hypothetical protein [Mucilaginibacter sp.]
MKTIVNPVDSVVQSMRKIRDEISSEIKDMTFAEEREYLDKLLKDGREKINTQRIKSNSSKS